MNEEEEIKKAFESVALPLIKKATATMISNELVQVTPMSAPTGTMMWFDYKDGKIFPSKTEEQIKKEKDLEDFYDENC